MKSAGELSNFCCPGCHSSRLAWELVSDAEERRYFFCLDCHSRFFFETGIFDFLGDSIQEEVITPFQRLMQFGPLTAIYERFWRPAGFFVASSRSFKRFAAQVIEWVDPVHQKQILDLACGPGLFTLPIARQIPGQVTGFDLSFPMLRQAQKRLEQGGATQFNLIRGTAFRLPFSDCCFDAILCSGALHLFDRPDSALQEISRVLKPGGKFICQTTLKPEHSVGVASFLDRVIRFGFFQSQAEISKLLTASDLIMERDWHRRIIYLFQARKL
jgi:ubiquinone/menaquinone biosynthesis C-methylase UbiE